MKSCYFIIQHDRVVAWEGPQYCWPFIGEIHRPPMYSLAKSQLRRALIFSLLSVRTSQLSCCSDALTLKKTKHVITGFHGTRARFQIKDCLIFVMGNTILIRHLHIGTAPCLRYVLCAMREGSPWFGAIKKRLTSNSILYTTILELYCVNRINLRVIGEPILCLHRWTIDQSDSVNVPFQILPEVCNGSLGIWITEVHT